MNILKKSNEIKLDIVGMLEKGLKDLEEKRSMFNKRVNVKIDKLQIKRKKINVDFTIFNQKLCS